MNFLLDKAKDNDYAFMDSKAYVIKYLPPFLMGSYTLKPRMFNDKFTFKFGLNSDAKVYIAYPSDLGLDPLGSKWKTEDVQFALLK